MKHIHLWCAVITLLLSKQLQAATVAWSGASGTDTNWSNSANWSGGVVPGGGDDVKFFDVGITTFSKTNNVVDANLTIGSLQYGNTNNGHTTFIADGLTLTITNTGGLIAATPGDPGVAKRLTNAIAGALGTLNVTNPSAVISVNQGGAAGSSQAILDMTKLSTFTANVYAIGVGTSTSYNPGNSGNKLGGVLFLAQTNVISLGLTDTLANYQTGTRTNSIEIGRNPSNNGGIPIFLYLGQTNIIFLDSIDTGMGKQNGSAAWGWMGFNPAFNNSVAYFRGVSGGSSRVTWWCVGDGTTVGSSSNGGIGTNDFSNGSVDAKIEVLSLGRDATAVDTWVGPHRGILTFTNGIIDVNTAIIGNQSLETGASTTPCLGIVNVGSAAVFRVNTNLTLGFTTLATAAGTGTSGNLNVNGGTVYANYITVGASSSANNIRLANATLIVTNTIATNALSLNLGMTNSTLGLSVTANGSLRVLAKSLLTGGATNLILLDAKPVFFASYPQQFPLIKYTTWTGTNNFGLTNVPAWAVGATLVSNGPNSSLDLSLPSDPRPIVTAQPTPYSGSPGDSVTTNFSVTIAAASVTPLGYQWYYTNGVSTNTLSDGTGPSGSSTLSGSTTINLQIANAQPGDNGGYFVVVTNAFGTNTSSQVLLTISAGAIAPTANGPASQTATNTITTAIVDSTSGSPVPTLFWYFNGTQITDGTGPSGSSIISGSSSSALTISNPQYPGDQGTYSMVASNSAGLATNNTVLTVIVPPIITSQPMSSVVTNTQAASFTVAVTGVPAPTFQWNKNGTPIFSGVNNTATNATFSIASVSPTDTASYTVTVSNPAGSTNSAAISLTVNSTMTVAALSPANAATGICYDTPLSLTLGSAPTLRNSGKIRIYNITNSTTPVDTLDMGLNLNANPTYAAAVQARNIGGGTFSNFPVIINGNTAVIYPHLGVMTNNQTYYVTIDNGVFSDNTGAYFVGIAATNVWQFTTKPAGPANPTNIVVTADGSGDFVTVQGAVDSIPANSTTPTLINIRNGFYNGIVYVNSKHNIKFRGQSRTGAVIGYPNNNWVNGNGAPWRAMFVLNGNDCSFENLTITNTTPKGGSQAEAVDVEGTRTIFYNMEMDSFQDTFLVHSANKLVYFQNCLIQGDTDFNWGYGTVYYTNCEIRCLSSGGHLTQPRSPQGTNGFGFINCRITKGYSGASTFDLGRTITTPLTSPSEVLFANCLMDDVVTGYSSDAGTNMADYACSNLTATTTKTLTFSTHSPGTDPFVIAIQSAVTWFYGWSPQLAPNILTNPVSQTVNYGSSATFTVMATGIPDPTYQWQHAGTNLPSATSAALTVGSATLADGGTYMVIVTTPAGNVTSTTVTLTVNPPPNTTPVFTAPLAGTNIAINVGINLSVACTATDSDIPAQTLVYSLLNGPSGATINTNSGILTWRPTVAQGNSSNPVSVAVTDNGIPNLSATNSFSISVNPLTQPSVDSAAYSAGQFTLSVSGQVGPDYTVQVSTNLMDGFWNTIFTTNPAAMPFSFTDPSGALPVQFYRILVGP